MLCTALRNGDATSSGITTVVTAAASMDGSASATRPTAAPPCTVSRPAQRVFERAARSSVRNTVSRSSATPISSRAFRIESGASRPSVTMGCDCARCELASRATGTPELGVSAALGIRGAVSPATSAASVTARFGTWPTMVERRFRAASGIASISITTSTSGARSTAASKRMVASASPTGPSGFVRRVGGTAAAAGSGAAWSRAGAGAAGRRPEGNGCVEPRAISSMITDRARPTGSELGSTSRDRASVVKRVGASTSYATAKARCHRYSGTISGCSGRSIRSARSSSAVISSGEHTSTRTASPSIATGTARYCWARSRSISAVAAGSAALPSSRAAGGSPDASARYCTSRSSGTRLISRRIVSRLPP